MIARLWTALLFCALAAPAPAAAAIRVVAGRDVPDGLDRPVAVEFLDAQGKRLKLLRLEGSFEDMLLGAEDRFETMTCPTGRMVAVTHRRRDPQQRNPYAIRRARTGEITWYREDGSEAGRMPVPARARVVAVSADCRIWMVLDEGFSPEDFTAFNDVPWIRSTAQLADDRELVDHVLYAVRPTGQVAMSRRIPGPEEAPNHVEVSPNGRWFVYKLGTPAAYVVNIARRLEDRFATNLPVDWKIDDRGELYGYRPRGKSRAQVLYVRKPGAPQAVAVSSRREP